MNIEKRTLQNCIDFKSILELSIEGVYIIANDVDKKVYLGYAVNILAKVSQICYDIERHRTGLNNMELDKDKLVLSIISCKREEARLVMNSQLQEFICLGYTEYRKTPIAKLRIKQLVVMEGSEACIMVVLRNTRGKDIVVGKFSNKEEADSFVSRCYPSSVITKIIYDKSVAS